MLILIFFIFLGSTPLTGNESLPSARRVFAKYEYESKSESESDSKSESESKSESITTPYHHATISGRGPEVVA